MNEEQIALIQQKYNCRIIQQNGDYLFNSADIGKILELSNIHKSMQHLNDTDKKCIPCIDTLKRRQKMIYLTYTGLCKVLIKTRKPNILRIANDFGINLLRQINSCIEAEILNNIKIAFNNENSIDQYTIDNYRIDLYFPDYKLAIECDEDGHNIVLDELREQYIKDKIGCKFIRFKPYTKDFNIFQLINQIHQFIVLSLCNRRNTH